MMPNIHTVVECSFFPQFKDAVNEKTRQIGTQFIKSFKQKIAKRKSQPPDANQGKVNIKNWLIMARRMQILSIFPRLSNLKATAKLSLTRKQNSKKN